MNSGKKGKGVSVSETMLLKMNSKVVPSELAVCWAPVDHHLCSLLLGQAHP